MQRITVAALTLGLFASAVPAQASEHELYYAHAGAMLDFAEAEVRVVYAAVTQRVFDPTITRQSTEELERVLEQSKRQVGRAATLLPEKLEKHRDAIEQLKQQIIAAERQLEKMKTIIEETVEAQSVDEEEEELEEGEAPKADWAGMQASCAWLAKDVRQAKATHAALATRLGIKPLRAPPAPRAPRGD